MTIRPTQLMAKVTTTAMQTVNSACVFSVGMPREEASCGCTAVRNSRFAARRIRYNFLGAARKLEGESYTNKEIDKMAKKGDWVRIHSIVLKAEERTAKLPDDTKKCDLQQWTKGFLQNEEAKLGDEVTVKTAVGRLVEGTLIDEAPYYTHSYGKFVPEIIEIDRQLREIMNFGGEA